MFAGTVANHTLFLSLNEGASFFDGPAERKGVLVALDLKREGFILWRRGGEAEEDSRLKGMVFSGAPAVADGRVFLLGTRHLGTGEARAEVYLLGFHGRDGRLLFRRFLCSGAEVDRFEIRLGSKTRSKRDRVELGSPIAEYGGVLYCLTNLGVAGAVDAFTGRIIWLFKYNRIFSQNPDQYYRDFFLDTGGWKDNLPILKNGRLYLTPRDSRFLYCLALDPDPEGYIILDDPIEKGRMISLIGIQNNRFYFSAREGERNYAVATDPNGAVIWETLPFEREDRIAGRPLMTQKALWIPTERTLYRVDLEKEGLITHLFPLPDSLREMRNGQIRFGNIVTIKDYLVSVSNEDVIVLKGESE
jgi:outer membrane protein assembly factor BamB